MAKIDENTVIENGIVMGFIILPSHTPVDFEICSVENWLLLSEEEAEKEAIDCFHESGIATDYDLEDVDWWY